MAQIKILTEQELRGVIHLDLDAISCVEQAFTALSQGTAVMPPILRLDIKEYNGEVDVKTAYVPGLDSFALKVSPGFFDNPKIGLPSLNGLMILFSAKTGLVEAILLDNGYLTAVRTAAAGAVAAKYLSRETSETATIIGSGEQAQLQLEALMLVRPVKKACYWSRNYDQAQQVAARMSDRTGIWVTAEVDAGRAVASADIIVTCTPATEPVVQAGWLKPGQHLTAMGSDAEHKNELDPQILKIADMYAPDSLSQVRRLGELHHAIVAGVVQKDRIFAEIGSIIAGAAAGRKADDDLTVADLTGVGVQDTAIATLAYSRAITAKSGTTFDS